MNKLCRRFIISKRFEMEEQEAEERFRRSEQGSSKYADPNGKELTNEQKKEIDQYWSKYSFAIQKVDYNAYKTYMNRSGIFDVRYIPHGVRARFLTPYMAPDKYKTAWQNKAYASSLFGNVKQPKILVRKVEGIYYDCDFYKISAGEAVRICTEYLKSGSEIVIKPNGFNGGKGVEFINSMSEKQLRAMFKRKGRLFVVQESIRQHPEMKKLNESSVNAVRLTTLLEKQKIVPLAALIKVGAAESRVDNFYFGGYLVPLNLDGTAYPWALSLDQGRVDQLPSGMNLSKEKFVVPSFEKILKMAETAHLEIPKMKMASWTISIDETGNPIIIDANFSGDIRMHQSVTGPIFGEYTEEILDKYLLGRFYRHRASFNFDYKEYYDHIEIENYDGQSERVKVPAKLNGKLVTKIGSEAFARHKKLKKVILPKNLETIDKRAFVACTNLVEVNLWDTKVNQIGAEAFLLCPELSQATKNIVSSIKSGKSE